jgi:hypothetical protein
MHFSIFLSGNTATYVDEFETENYTS